MQDVVKVVTGGATSVTILELVATLATLAVAETVRRLSTHVAFLIRARDC